MKAKLIFLMLLLAGLLTTCKDNPGDGGDAKLPSSVSISAPSANQTYWDDQAVACKHNQPSYSDQITWLVNGEEVACADGELADTLSAGEHSVMARIADEGKAVEAAVTITVKEGFAVTLEAPKDGAEYFVGDNVSCQASIEPEQYAEHLQITVGGNDCTAEQAELTEAGDITVRAFATIDARSEADEATVVAKPSVSGRILPLTSDGVVEASGFTVRLKTADGQLTTTTNSDGSFSFIDAPADIYMRENVAIEVVGTPDFYGAKTELFDLKYDLSINDYRPRPAGEYLRELIAADELGFVLAPKSWTIRAGKLSGQSTTIKLADAFESGADINFYWLRSWNGELILSTLYPGRAVKAAFDPESNLEISKADSADFWSGLETLPQHVGLGSMFVPGAVSSLWEGFLILADSTETLPSAGPHVYDDNDFIEGGRFKFPRLSSMRARGLVSHEGSHASGFGHMCRWVTFMTTTNCDDGDSSEGSNFPTVDDVAHMQLAMLANQLRADEGVRFGLLATDAGRAAVLRAEEARNSKGKHAGSYIHEPSGCFVH